MDIGDLVKDAKDLSSSEFERRLNKLARENYHFRNLSAGNKKIIMDLVGKYASDIRSEGGISAYALQSEGYKLHMDRIKLGLTEKDVKDIKEILAMLKK